MRGKKAKLLRQIARRITVGEAGSTHITKHYTRHVKNDKGEWVVTHPPYVTVDPKSTRGVYRNLKKVARQEARGK